MLGINRFEEVLSFHCVHSMVTLQSVALYTICRGGKLKGTPLWHKYATNTTKMCCMTIFRLIAFLFLAGDYTHDLVFHEVIHGLG